MSRAGSLPGAGASSLLPGGWLRETLGVMNRHGALTLQAGLLAVVALLVVAAVGFVLTQDAGVRTEGASGDQESDREPGGGEASLGTSPAELEELSSVPSPPEEHEEDARPEIADTAVAFLAISVHDAQGRPVTGAEVEWQKPGQEWNLAGRSMDQPIRLASFNEQIVLRASWQGRQSVPLVLAADAEGAYTLVVPLPERR